MVNGQWLIARGGPSTLNSDIAKPLTINQQPLTLSPLLIEQVQIENRHRVDVLLRRVLVARHEVVLVVGAVPRVDGLELLHAPLPGPVTHEVSGHLHPAAKLSVYGHRIRRPCFVGNGRRLVLPAFGAFTGGLNILDDTFAGLFGNDGFAVWMLGDDGLYPVAPRLLKPDRNGSP